MHDPVPDPIQEKLSSLKKRFMQSEESEIPTP